MIRKLVRRSQSAECHDCLWVNPGLDTNGRPSYGKLPEAARRHANEHNHYVTLTVAEYYEYRPDGEPPPVNARGIAVVNN